MNGTIKCKVVRFGQLMIAFVTFGQSKFSEFLYEQRYSSDNCSHIFVLSVAKKSNAYQYRMILIDVKLLNEAWCLMICGNGEKKMS